MLANELQDAKRLLRWASLLTFITIAVFILDRVTGCSTQVKDRIVKAPVASCEGEELGSTKDDVCAENQDGKKILVCTSDGYKEAVNTCVNRPAPPVGCLATKTSFAAVQPILARNCIGSCHTDHHTYAVAKAKATEYQRRFKLKFGEPGHMPMNGDLTGQEKLLFDNWVADGLCEAPDEPAPGGLGFQSHEDTVGVLLADITNTQKVDVQKRQTTRWLIATDIIDSGGSREKLDQYKRAAQKAVNSISTKRDMAPVEEIAPGIYRFNMDDIGMDQKEWKRVEDADLVNIESKTSKGQLLTIIVGTRKPFMHVESFIDAALQNSSVYYDLTETPSTFQQLTVNLGVDYARDLQIRDVVLSAFVGSPLSPHNRMVSVHKSRDGSFWCTYDTGPLDTPQKNYFQFPLLADIGGKLNAQFVAGECIYTLPNGLHGYALFNAKDTVRNVGRTDRNGNPVYDSQGRQLVDRIFLRSDLNALQDVAPIAVVRDFLSPVSAEIRSGISCFNCHAPGMLGVTDQIRRSVIENGAQFGTDKDLILDVYKKQPDMDKQLSFENGRYVNALKAFGIAPTDEEPITAAFNSLRLPWNLNKVCGKIWLALDDCKTLLRQSATAQAQWGQLSTGGSITFEQFFTSLKAISDELRLFQDEL